MAIPAEYPQHLVGAINHPSVARDAVTPHDVDLREYRLFQALDRACKRSIQRRDLTAVLSEAGLALDDARLAESMRALASHGESDAIAYDEFCRIVRPNILLIEKAIQGQLAIPDFAPFCREVGAMFEATRDQRDGDVARYIPQLAKVDPERYATALCTIDGQRFAAGDAQTSFCVQSCGKPINYCLALEEHGEDHVHRFVGREPSGHGFNELTLNREGKPHNPLINAGAIMCLSLIRGGHDIADRFEHVTALWEAMAGGRRPGFNNSVYLSERQTADRNYALGYFMREHKAFPEGTDLLQTLEFYFQCCSIELDAETMAVVAATLANGGVCPLTGERVLRPTTVRDCLSVMYSCGMYDFSGEFAFTIGLPAKSGVSGALLVVVPNVLGMCVWSPRVDAQGNSVRGLELCRQLVKTFNFHNYDTLSGLSDKTDPRVSRIEAAAQKVDVLIWAASKGDLGAIQGLVARGIDLDGADYDNRTPLHLAAAEGRVEVVRYFVDRGANLNPRDRWGGTPLDDAGLHGHGDVAALLEQHGAVSGAIERTSRATEAPAGPPPRESERVVELIWAASRNDLRAIQRLVARGVALDGADYDQRTALHLAACEGHAEVVRYFIDQGVPLAPRDRWGGTPLDDAKRHRHANVVELLVGKS